MSKIREKMDKLEVKSNLTKADSSLTNFNDYRHVVKVCEESLDVSDKKLIEQAEHVKSILKLGNEEEISRNVLEGIKIYETREQVRDLIIEFLMKDLSSSFEVTKYLFVTVVGIPLLILAYKGARHFYKFLVR